MKTSQADSGATPYDRDVQLDWWARTEDAVRALSDDLIVSDMSEFAPLLHRSIDRLEAAPDRLHSALLSLRLLDVCRAIVETIHAFQPSTRCSCHAAAWTYLRLLTRLDDDPRIVFARWVDQFLAHAVAQHPSTPAQTAAALLRAAPARAWTLRDLANEIGVHQSRLSREFERLFHLRPGEYLHLVRVSHAVAMFRAPTKVEVIAADVGYRSKKDFYAALRRWVGLTPTELRSLRDDESEWLARDLRQRCLRSADGHGNRTIRVQTTGSTTVSVTFRGPNVVTAGAREPAGSPSCRQPPPHRR